MSIHIDDWIEAYIPNSESERQVKEWLTHFRQPIVSHDRKFLDSKMLFTTYAGQRYRCTGASRLGDVWLATDHTRRCGYDKRVMMEDCSEWTVLLSKD